jgi:hypothetical protein
MFCNGGDDYWPLFATELTELDYRPAYWLGPPSLEAAVQSQFDDVTYHSTSDADVGIGPRGEQTLPASLDAVDAATYDSIKPTVLK